MNIVCYLRDKTKRHILTKPETLSESWVTGPSGFTYGGSISMEVVRGFRPEDAELVLNWYGRELRIDFYLTSQRLHNLDTVRLSLGDLTINPVMILYGGEDS